MAQLGKQMSVGARKGFAYRSVILVLLANGNRYDRMRLIPIHFFLSGEVLYPFEVLPCSNSDLFFRHAFVSVDCARIAGLIGWILKSRF